MTFPRSDPILAKMDENLPTEDVFNRSEERAVINLLNPNIQASFIAAQNARPELFGLEEKELLKLLSTGERGPSPVANSLRMKFWFEYDEAQAERRKMKVMNIYTGVCDSIHFYKSFLKNPEKVAWLLTRPASYEAAIEEMHLFALSRMREALEVTPVVNGKLDSKAAELQFKILQMLDTRLKGAVVQKTMNLHSTIPAKKSGMTDQARNEELEKRIKELEQLRDKSQIKIIDARIVDTE